MTVELIFDIAGVFFAIYLFFYATFIFIGNASAVVNLFKARRRKLLDNILKHPYYFPVSIIVPAFNESFTILGTVDHLLHLDYEIYEIIIVDDGSTDDTATKIIDTYHMEKQEGPLRVQVPSKPIQEIYTPQFQKHRITLVRKENGRSKADAVNAGINVATYPYFISMDADEILQTDALKNSARLVLEDENVVAVGGLLNISNGVTFKNARAVDTPLTRNPVAAMQSLEYTRAFMGSRVFNDSFNGNLNVSGGYGLFQKKAVIEIGGYDPKSVGEDMDLALRLHKHFAGKNIPYSIKFAADAVCWTQAPFTLKDLANQRSRWHRGLIQSMWNHRDFFMNRQYGHISLISYTYFLLYELLAPFVELAGVLLIALAIYTNYINWPFTIAVTILYSFFSVLQSLIFFAGRYFIQDYTYYSSDFVWAILISLADLFFFRPYLLSIRLFATLTYKKYLHSWNKIVRKSFD